MRTVQDPSPPTPSRITVKFRSGTKVVALFHLFILRDTQYNQYGGRVTVAVHLQRSPVILILVACKKNLLCMRDPSNKSTIDSTLYHYYSLPVWGVQLRASTSDTTEITPQQQCIPFIYERAGGLATRGNILSHSEHDFRLHLALTKTNF